MCVPCMFSNEKTLGIMNVNKRKTFSHLPKCSIHLPNNNNKHSLLSCSKYSFYFSCFFFHYFVLFLFALCLFRFYVSVLEAAAASVDGILHAQNRTQDWMKNNTQKKKKKEQNRHIHSRCLLFFSFMYFKRLMRMCTLTFYISSPTHSHAVFHYNYTKNRKKKRISIFFCCLLLFYHFAGLPMCTIQLHASAVYICWIYKCMRVYWWSRSKFQTTMVKRIYCRALYSWVLYGDSVVRLFVKPLYQNIFNTNTIYKFIFCWLLNTSNWTTTHNVEITTSKSK